MTDIVLFGGTTEGRLLAELLAEKQIAALVCVATEYGEALLPQREGLCVRTGRLNRDGMAALLMAERPRAVIDATHPYAAEASDNIRAACEAAGIEYIRLIREAAFGEGDVRFSSMEAMVSWLNIRPGTIFSTLGAKEAPALSKVTGYSDRIWLRILPDAEGLAACIRLGFPARRIICMQGPFSPELNAAMFRAAGADILLTKESGAAGGCAEKLEAARACGMTAAVLARPGAESGLSLAALTARIKGGAL